MAYPFTLPGRTVIGENALAACEALIRGFGGKPLVVTGRIVKKTEAFASLQSSLENWSLRYAVFDGVTGEPTDQMIEAGVRAYREENCDFLIAIGGGSPLDSAKAIAAMTTLGGAIADYKEKEISGDFPPLVLIPTTAGTGSEATRFTIITDTDKDVKMLLQGDDLLPDLAVIDPDFGLTAPPSVTAATGMDALTHAVEAYTSRKANSLTDPYALDAVQRIFAVLPTAFQDGSNRKAREEMAIAAYEAGVCINNASVTIVHGMSRPIGALFHVPHGISNAMLITECLRYVQDGCYQRFAKLAKGIGAAKPGTNDREASEAFITALQNLCKTLQIPSLAEYGIEKKAYEQALAKMAKDAMMSGSPSNTRKPVGEEDLLTIYRKLF